MYSMKEKHINTNIKDLNLYYLCVKPEGEIKGVIQLVHGMCEHKERYIPFMKFLAQNGYASFIHDKRGHGKSIRVKMDLGYVYGKGNDLIDDIVRINEIIRKEYPNKEIYLIGHSMGSLEVRAFFGKNSHLVNKLVVIGSPSNNKLLKLARGIVNLQSALKGDRHRSKLIESLSFKPYDKKFKDHPTNKSWLCSDILVCKEYMDSELCGFTFTCNAYKALFDVMELAYSKDNYELKNKNIKILFLSGEDDPCLINIKEFKAAVNVFREAGYTNVNAKLYKGMRHEILNEINKDRVYSDILNFIEEAEEIK